MPCRPSLEQECVGKEGLTPSDSMLLYSVEWIPDLSVRNIMWLEQASNRIPLIDCVSRSSRTCISNLNGSWPERNNVHVRGNIFAATNEEAQFVRKCTKI